MGPPDRDAQQRSEASSHEAVERLEALEAVAEALSGALSTEDVARVVIERGLAIAKADTCTLYTLDERTKFLELIAEHGCSPELIERIRRLTPESNSPAYESMRNGKAEWAESLEEYASYDAALARSDEARARAFWSVPLIAEGRAIGLLGMGFYSPRTFATEERAFIKTFAHQFAEALLRARRLESERSARIAAETAQASFATTLRSIGDAVIATDATGAITLMNPVAESLTGWTEAQAKGHRLPEVFHIINENTRAIVPSPVDKVLELGAVVGLANHTVLVTRDGREIPIDDSGAPIRRENGPIEGVVLVFRDVTEKKREESRRTFLGEATALLADSLDYETTLSKVAQLAVPGLADWCAVDIVEDGERKPRRLGVAHVDPSKVQLAKELEEKYPSPVDAPTGLPNVLRTGRAELYEEIPEALLIAGCVDEEHLRLALALKLRSAMIVPLRARERVLGAITFVWAESGRNYTKDDLQFAKDLAHRCAVAIDNARLYATAQRARLSADVANRSKDEFLAIVSHELRTPLNAIMGWAKVMTLPEFDESKRARAIETIERNSVAMAQLIEDLLDISRIISGKMRLEVQQLDLTRIIEAAIESVKPAADAKTINLTLEQAAPAPFTIAGDPTRLQQIVWNLLSNAVKFTPKGGRVDVLVSRDETWAEVKVSDSGKGIADKFLPHVFESFRQEDASHSRSRGGLGLGLAITRQLVELHGGAIDAQSAGEGSGATFTVRLPIASTALTTTISSEKTRRIAYEVPFDRPEQLRDLRVLVVDDERDARQLVEAILSQCGCHVTLAGSVDEALTAFTARIPDILISDIAMPERDGYELIRRIRALSRENGGDVPAAALTAYARAEDRRKMLDAGFSMHIAKPVEPAELVSIITSLTRFANRRA